MKLLPGPGRYIYMYSLYLPLSERPRQCSGQDHDLAFGSYLSGIYLFTRRESVPLEVGKLGEINFCAAPRSEGGDLGYCM